jgi:hypothetical protein
MDDSNKNRSQKASRSERAKVIGGLIAVGIGVLAVLIIALAAISKNTSTSSTIASAASGVIAAIVGAFFGLKLGSDQAKDANQQKDAQAAKAEVYALHLPEGKAVGVREEAEAAAASVLTR